MHSRRQGTCFVIPPPGKKNSNGQTAAEALDDCKNRCNANNKKCTAVVVVPTVMPAEVALGSGEETNAPWGRGNCDHSCFDNEPEGSKVSDVLRVHVRIEGGGTRTWKWTDVHVHALLHMYTV